MEKNVWPCVATKNKRFETFFRESLEYLLNFSCFKRKLQKYDIFIPCKNNNVFVHKLVPILPLERGGASLHFGLGR